LVGISKYFGVDQMVPEHGVILATVSGYAEWEYGLKAAYLGVFSNGKDSTSTCCAWGKYHTFGNKYHAKWAPVAFTNAIAVKPGTAKLDVKGRSFDGSVTLKDMSIQSVFLPGATVVEKVSHTWSLHTTNIHQKDFVRFGDLWARVHAQTSGVIALTLNGHVHNAGTNNAHVWLSMGFFVDGDDCSPQQEKGEIKDGHEDAYGKYYTYASAQQSEWVPASFTQFVRVDAGMHEVELRAKAHSLSDYRLNGAAFTAVFIPDHHIATSSMSHPVTIAEDVTQADSKSRKPTRSKTVVGALTKKGSMDYLTVQSVPSMRADASTHGLLLSTANGMTHAGYNKKETGYLAFITNRRDNVSPDWGRYHAYTALNSPLQRHSSAEYIGLAVEWAPASLTQFTMAARGRRYVTLQAKSSGQWDNGDNKEAYGGGWPVKGLDATTVFVPRGSVHTAKAEWKRKIESPWYGRLGDSAELWHEVPSDGVLLVAANGHTSGGSGDGSPFWKKRALYMGVWVDGTDTVSVKDSSSNAHDWGKFRAYDDSNSLISSPLSYTSAIAVHAGTHRVDMRAKTTQGSYTVNGAALQSAFLPGALLLSQRPTGTWSVALPPSSAVSVKPSTLGGGLSVRVHAAHSGVLILIVNGHIQHTPLSNKEAQKQTKKALEKRKGAKAAPTVEYGMEMGFFVNSMQVADADDAGKYMMRASMIGGQSSSKPQPHRASSTTPVSLVQYLRVEPGAHDVSLRSRTTLGVYVADVSAGSGSTKAKTNLLANLVAVDGYGHSLDGAVVTVVLIPDQTDPVDCKLADEWTTFGQCSKSCGKGGVATSVRPIIHGPKSGGKKCPARTRLTRTQSCFIGDCPVHCQLSDWSAFGACTHSCGGGTSKRTRSAVVASQHGGMRCGSVGALGHVKQCNTQLCPVDCQLSSSGWGACSKTCGQGVAAERRAFVAEPKYGGKACPAKKDLTRIKICELRTCQCSHLTCKVVDGRVRVLHHNKELYGSQHICKLGLWAAGKCGCHCNDVIAPHMFSP
jgi:hypothetical protein